MDDVETRKQAAIDLIGRDGVVIVRPGGSVVAIDLKLGRKKRGATKGSNRKPLAPKASPAQVAGYRVAQELAQTRADERTTKAEKAIWESLAGYCKGMADSQALDDDQFHFQRSKARHYREVPMDQELMLAAEADGRIQEAWSTTNEETSKWKWLAIEMAYELLSPLQRACLEMHVAGRLEMQEIADALGIKRRMVKRHISEAREKFRTKAAPLVKMVFDYGVSAYRPEPKRKRVTRKTAP